MPARGPVLTDRNHDSLVRRQFGASAEHYRTSPSHARGRSLARLLELTVPQPDWTVLDVATGAGHTAATLAPHVGSVIAGDMTREMLEQAGIVAREQKLANIHFIQERARDLAYRDGVFDLVTCRVAAHHFPDPGRFVSEAARVLKTGGLLAVVDNVVPDDETAADWINEFERQRDPSHARCLGTAEWRRLFATSDLAVIHSEVNPKWFEFHDWMRRMNPAPATTEHLERALLAAPDGIRRFWQPTGGPEGLKLALQEAILIGKRQP